MTESKTAPEVPHADLISKAREAAEAWGPVGSTGPLFAALADALAALALHDAEVKAQALKELTARLVRNAQYPVRVAAIIENMVDEYSEEAK